MTFSWAKNLKIGDSFSKFHRITLWSSEHEANDLLSAEALTFLTQPSWPINVFLQKPVLIYQSLIVLSLEQDRRKSPPKTKST